MPGWLRRLLTPSLNWLLLFFPLAFVLEVGHAQHAAWSSPTWIFVCAALAIIPMAGWMGHATETLASRLGDAVGGLLNATFGNAAELIIAVMALIEGYRNPESLQAMHDLVKASLTGSILGNVLLVMGVALVAGGIKHRSQAFNAIGVRVSGTLLLLAVTSLMIPALFAHFVHDEAGGGRAATLHDISLEISVLLLVVYALSLVFTLRTHKHLYAPDFAELDATKEEHTATAGHAAHAAPHGSTGKALGVLMLATVGVAVLAEFMIGSVEEASKQIGLSELFVGVIVLAIVGNAAEHSTAVLVAWRNRMDLSLAIAMGSSIQVALFIAPALVLISTGMGTPMDLVFTPAELLALAIGILVVKQISNDGESNWLEGMLLLVVYAMLGVLFYHLPGA